jgi:hypothetical protein
VLSARACKVKVYKIEWKAEVGLLRRSCALWRQTQHQQSWRQEEEEEAVEEEEEEEVEKLLRLLILWLQLCHKT